MDIVGCLPWKYRHLCPQLAGVKRTCANCKEDVVLQAANGDAAKGMIIMCVPCLFRRFPDLAPENFGGLISGKKVEGLTNALRAAELVERRN
jgi:hypothetical protein